MKQYFSKESIDSAKGFLLDEEDDEEDEEFKGPGGFDNDSG